MTALLRLGMRVGRSGRARPGFRADHVLTAIVNPVVPHDWIEQNGEHE